MSFHSSLSTHPSLYRQKTALIVTIILIRLFIPIERNVLHSRDTHIQIDHDTLSIIVIAILNQRSVVAEKEKEEKKKFNNNNRTGFRLLGLHMIVPTRPAVMSRLIESMVVEILQIGATALNIVRFEGRKDLIGRHEHYIYPYPINLTYFSFL